MRFNLLTNITFTYQGQQVNWTIQELDTQNWVDNTTRKWKINCQHPIFINTFHAPTIVANCLNDLIQKGAHYNDNFFTQMRFFFLIIQITIKQ